MVVSIILHPSGGLLVGGAPGIPPTSAEFEGIVADATARSRDRLASPLMRTAPRGFSDLGTRLELLSPRCPSGCFAPPTCETAPPFSRSHHWAGGSDPYLKGGRGPPTGGSSRLERGIAEPADAPGSLPDSPRRSASRVTATYSAFVRLTASLFPRFSVVESFGRPTLFRFTVLTPPIARHTVEHEISRPR